MLTAWKTQILGLSDSCTTRKRCISKVFPDQSKSLRRFDREFRVWNRELTDIEIGTYPELNYRAMKVACRIVNSLKERVMC